MTSENLTCEIGLGLQADDFRCRMEQFSHFGLLGRFGSFLFLKGLRIGVSIGVRARSSAEIEPEDRDFIFRVSGGFRFDFSIILQLAILQLPFSGVLGRIKAVVVWSSVCMFSVLCVFQVHGTNIEF